MDNVNLGYDYHVLRAAFNAIPDVAFVRDSNGTVLLTNRLYASFFGLTPFEVEGRRQNELYETVGWSQPRLEKWLEEDLAVMDSGKTLELEEEVLHMNGTISKFKTLKIPIELPEGGKAVLVFSERRT